MANENAFDEDPLAGGTSYSQLLFGDHDDEVVSLDFNFNPHSSSENSSKMLCFGDYGKEINKMPAQKGCLTTCSVSSTISDNVKSLSKTNKKRNWSVNDSLMLQSSNGDADGNQKNKKKPKADNSTTGHAKVKKEKLGERITALQQLVSPFGKTDTASVLHEAMGYIKFLQDQVNVLCSPYLQRLPSSNNLCDGEENVEAKKASKELRSRGLCLVPVEITSHFAETNGADFWSPAMGSNMLSDQ